jgi:hypothetical protein
MTLGTATATAFEKTVERLGRRVESLSFPLGSGRFNGHLTARSRTSTSTSPSKIRAAEREIGLTISYN